jgi:hypothetical protein
VFSLIWAMAGLIVGTWLKLINVYARSLIIHLLNRRGPGDPEAPLLETGLYWFGLGNTCEPDDGAPEGNKSFDPSRPTVIYVHGFQPHTVAR